MTKSSIIFGFLLLISKVIPHLSEPIASDRLSKNSFMDLDGIINNFFPNLNQGGTNDQNGHDSGIPQNSGNVNSPEGKVWNNENGTPDINYPENSRIYPGGYSQRQKPVYPNYSDGMQGTNPHFPGNVINNGFYSGNTNPSQGYYQANPGNGNNGNYYLQNPNIMQGSYPLYPGNNLGNANPNYNYPGNSNVVQGVNPQYPGQGSGLNQINRRPGINYPTNPSASNQGNIGSYPGYSNWNSNNLRYPGNYQSKPNFNGQDQYPDTNWSSANGLQNNQRPNQIVTPGNQQTLGLNQNPEIQGQPIQYPNSLENYNPGLQNGGSFQPQVSNGWNNQLPNDNLQNPNMQYPQLQDPTTEKSVIGSPVVTSTVTHLVTSTTAAMKQCVQDCPCTSEYNPVCGNNKVTYFNEGKFECARKCGIDVTIVRHSACPLSSSYKP